MKASIIIPAFNEEKYIEDTLKAVLKQDYADFEVIVIDNNSTDQTVSKVNSLGVKVISEKKKGTMHACETGRLASTGEVIVRLDADCIPYTDWLSRGMKHFIKENVVAVTGPYEYFDASRRFRFVSSFIQKYIYSVSHNITQSLGLGAILIGGNSFMRSETLAKMGGFDTSIQFYGDDTDTARRLSKYGKVVFDKSLDLKSSARRFKNEGVLKIYFLYLSSFFKKTLFFKKSRNT